MSIGAAEARAVITTQTNPVLEKTVSFDTSKDMEFGFWDSKARTFTVITGVGTCDGVKGPDFKVTPPAF